MSEPTCSGRWEHRADRGPNSGQLRRSIWVPGPTCNKQCSGCKEALEKGKDR